MKGKPSEKCVHQKAWEKLLNTNDAPIYLGDHMTRTWEKIGKDEEEKRRNERRKMSSKSQTKFKLSDSDSDQFSKILTPGDRCTRRKLSTERRKLHIGKDILTRHNITKKDIVEWQTSFDALLNSQAGCYLFKLFLESEIADENLKFWLACEDLKNTKQKRLAKRIQDIFDTYINVYSPHEINIDYKMREEIVDQLKYKADVSIFSEAQHQVYRLMHRDSYPRFLNSPIAAELAKMLSDQEDEDGKSGRRSRDDSLSISELVLCCYLRRWNSVDAIDEEESTSVTHAGISDLSRRNIRRSVSETNFSTNCNRTCSRITYSSNKYENAVFEDTSPSNSPPKDEFFSFDEDSSSENKFGMTSADCRARKKAKKQNQ